MTTTLLPKQRLKDYCRRKQYSPPQYILTDEEKIDLHKYYTIQVSINGLVTAEGRGLSRRIAEFKSAMNALALIGQSDPSVFENHGSTKFGRSFMGRSFSVDHISRHQRTDSIPSMMSLSMSPGQYTGQFSSAAPSIDGIDSLTENGDSLYGSETANGFDGRKESPSPPTSKSNKSTGVEEEEASSDSIDEGVYVESSESSSSPSVSSPTSPSSRAASVAEKDRLAAAASSKTESSQTQQKKASEQSTVASAESAGSSKSLPRSKPKQSKSLSSSFLSSFFLLSSLRAISRRSLRRKSNSSKNSSTTKAEFSFEDSATAATSPATGTTTTSQQQQAQSRPTSSSSSTSYASSTSSAFSSSSSISSSAQSSSTSTNSSTSGSFTLPDDSRVETDGGGPHVNGYSNLITESIIEEEEEEEENESVAPDCGAIKPRTESYSSATVCNGGPLADKFGSSTMPRSVASSYMLSTMCPHNHFSIYGPVLCSNTMAPKNLTIEATPSAALLRYCVRMYLPLPYYDIRFDSKFYVTCRVILTTSKGDRDKLPVTLPDQYRDHEFTARGNGESLRAARNMAAQTIIDKLKKATIYFE